MKRLFFVRHGESEMNVEKRFAGIVETPLTEHGRLQAKNAGTHIKQNLPHIDYIITSPLSRAEHTAQIIAEEISYPLTKIETNSLLVERSFGAAEGEHGPSFIEAHGGHEALDEVEGAETVKAVQERAEKAFEFLKKQKYENILVVAHGTFGRALWRVVNALPHTQEYEGERWRIGNAEVVELI